MKAVLIITYTGVYGWKALEECYDSIRKHNAGVLIIIVNNYDEPLINSLISDTNIRYFINSDNTYELGAIKHAVTFNKDIDYFYIIHDSCVVNTRLPDFDKNMFFWKTSTFDIAPVLSIVKEWCKDFFPEIVYNDKNGHICQGLMGYFERALLMRCFEHGLSNITVTNKQEAVASEGMFGLVLKHFESCIDSYYKMPLWVYVEDHSKCDWLVKKAGGKCLTHLPNISLHITKSKLSHPSHPFMFQFNNCQFNTLDECISLQTNENMKDKAVLHYYNNYREALEELVWERYWEFHVEDDINSVGARLTRFRHKIYELYHFGVIKE
jgi:hypothetical protein